MATVTLEELRNIVRRRGNWEEDGGVITPDDLTDEINLALQEFVDVVCSMDDGEILAKNHPLTTKLGSWAHQVEDDFYRLRSVHVNLGGQWVPAENTSPAEYAEMVTNPPDISNAKYYERFDLSTGSKYIYVFPELEPEKVAILYIPEAPQLVEKDDAVASLNGLVTDWVATKALIALKEKIEEDTTAAQIRLKRCEDRVRTATAALNLHRPDQVQKIWR